MKEGQDFEQFMQRRAQVARAYVEGDAEPLRAIVTQRSPASFFGPQGDYEKGADQVWKAYEAGASAFSPGGETALEIFEMAAGDDVGYWAGLQRAKVRIGGDADATSMDLRVTEVFRREGGEWKLVHRHADPAAVPQE
jgi:ketosteroid isomerase-like protein